MPTHSLSCIQSRGRLALDREAPSRASPAVGSVRKKPWSRDDRQLMKLGLSNIVVKERNAAKIFDRCLSPSDLPSAPKPLRVRASS